MREIGWMMVALLAAGCGGNSLSNGAAGGGVHDGGCVPPSPICATFTDASSCAADRADHCVWYGTGQDCPPNYPGTCSSGVCQGATDPACATGGDGGSAGVGCACPDGTVCVQKDGAPIACEQPSASCTAGSPACGCLPSSDGSCVPSSDVAGLCICTTAAASGCNCAGGQICVQQIGGPVMQVGSPPTLLCVTPTPGCPAGSSCGCVAGQGHCSPSTSGPAQCTCDNGIR